MDAIQLVKTDGSYVHSDRSGHGIQDPNPALFKGESLETKLFHFTTYPPVLESDTITVISIPSRVGWKNRMKREASTMKSLTDLRIRIFQLLSLAKLRHGPPVDPMNCLMHFPQ